MSEPGLEGYRRKRDPARTTEPFDADRPSGAPSQPLFVIQRHDARRLHYDLRLERDGALASWAVPRGLPLEPGDKRLAVHVEDHPLAYADFSGEIAAGEYGAGTVEIYDRGTYELLEEKRDGGLTVCLHGTKLEGIWTLVPASLHGDERNWLVLRKRDGASPPTVERRTYEPMLATLAGGVPHGEGWMYEVKWDGFRALCTVRGGEARIASRAGNDLTERFPEIARALPRAIRAPDCVLDGEVVAFDQAGRPSFSAMQRDATAVALYVFDCLEVDGESLVELPWSERRARLEALLVPGSALVRLSQAFADGDALLAAATEQQLEGILAKRVASRYQPGRRSRDWLKIKTHHRQEFLIAGYTAGAGRRAGGLGALVLAVAQGGDLHWAGNCGTGFTDAERADLHERLRPLVCQTSPFPVVPRMPRVRRDDVVWVEPRLVCEVEFAEWTRDGRLRAPSYKGLRGDKSPVAVRHERPISTELRRGGRVLELSNLDKVFWPEDGITKGDLLDYYRRVAPVLVPHLKGRPFTMKRFPDGIEGGHFFQKDAPSHLPPWIKTRPFLAHARRAGQARTIRYAIVDDELALLWMVNMGCIDMNTWLSRADRPDRPDAVLFDLDPADGTPFDVTVEVALLIRQLLHLIGLECCVKTSGSDGMHVLVPVTRRHTFAQTRELAAIVASTLARTHPSLVTTEWRRAKRHGVLIDANQNREGATIASVYSVRPRAGAPVSAPLRWDEVTPELDPRRFTMEVVAERASRHGDLFAPALAGGQSIGKALETLLS